MFVVLLRLKTLWSWSQDYYEGLQGTRKQTHGHIVAENVLAQDRWLGQIKSEIEHSPPYIDVSYKNFTNSLALSPPKP